MLGDDAGQVAAVVKMIQNTMIGGIAFLIALYWVARVERTGDAKPSARLLWDRFPKFVLGFLMASLLASFVFVPLLGAEETSAITKITKGFRGWFFALAFVAIGLDSNFRRLTAQLVGGKPILLYAVGSLSFWIAQNALYVNSLSLREGVCSYYLHNYVTDKNRRNMPEKFRIKKYCPKCRSHHSHKEGKISKG